MISLIKFAPEVEYNIINRNAYIHSRFNLSEDSLPFQFKWKDLDMEIDKEYYSDQIEFKVRSMPVTVDNIKRVQSAIKDFADDPIVDIASNGPDFVGTHIHLWYGGTIPSLLKLRGIKYLLQYFTIWFENKFKEAKNNSLATYSLELEVRRFLLNHNIWHYFDHRFMHDTLLSDMIDFGINGYAFMGGVSRPKYQPIVISPANESGKTETIEIRMIPNLWYLTETPEEIYRFLNGFMEAVNSKSRIESIREEIRMLRMQLFHFRWLKKNIYTRGLFSSDLYEGFSFTNYSSETSYKLNDTVAYISEMSTRELFEIQKNFNIQTTASVLTDDRVDTRISYESALANTGIRIDAPTDIARTATGISMMNHSQLYSFRTDIGISQPTEPSNGDSTITYF